MNIVKKNTVCFEIILDEKNPLPRNRVAQIKKERASLSYFLKYASNASFTS